MSQKQFIMDVGHILNIEVYNFQYFCFLKNFEKLNLHKLKTVMKKNNQKDKNVYLKFWK